MGLVEASIRNQGWIWSSLREGRKRGHQIGEESITDFALLNFKKWAPAEIAIKTFSKPKESVTGADWEWWLTGPSGKWLGMRVQAKVINLALAEYSHIHYYKPKKNCWQSDRLIADASQHGLVPIYCLYSNWDLRKHSAKYQPCDRYHPSVTHFGASVVTASAVNHLRDNGQQRSLAAVSPHMRPLHCIFCGNSAEGADLPTRAFDFFQMLRGLEVQLQCHLRESYYLRDTPPLYVEDLLSGERTMEWKELVDDNLGSIAVISESPASTPTAV